MTCKKGNLINVKEDAPQQLLVIVVIERYFIENKTRSCLTGFKTCVSLKNPGKNRLVTTTYQKLYVLKRHSFLFPQNLHQLLFSSLPIKKNRLSFLAYTVSRATEATGHQTIGHQPNFSKLLSLFVYAKCVLLACSPYAYYFINRAVFSVTFIVQNFVLSHFDFRF